MVSFFNTMESQMILSNFDTMCKRFISIHFILIHCYCLRDNHAAIKGFIILRNIML